MGQKAADIATIGRISAVPAMPKVISDMTGLRFAAVARVTDDTWTACAVFDQLDFGLGVGGELDLTTTICHEIRGSHVSVVIDKASEDPLTLKSFGHLSIRLHATEALLERAGEYLDRAQADSNAQTVAAASIAVAEVRALSTEISLAAGSTLFELAGSQATLAEHGLDRHWRNARVHTLHDPVRWKYHAVGAYRLNGTLPARHSWI